MASVREYRPALDGIRALAILGVMAQHLHLSWFRTGALGVDVFFTLSGYLITGLLVAERASTGSIRLRDFYLRRALRLLPALLLLLVVGGTAASVVLKVPNRDLVLGGLIAAGYLTDLASYTHTTVWTTYIWTWSLSIEEQFYLLWPSVLRTSLKRRVDARALAWGLSVVALLVAEVCARRGVNGGPPLDYFQPQAHAFCLLVGCAVAVSDTPAWSRHAALPAIAGLIALAAFSPNSDHYSYLRLSVPATAVVTAALIAGLEHTPALATRILSVTPVRRLGVISYGLYLYHQLVFALVVHWFHPSHGALVVEGGAAAIVVAELSYRFYEAPVRSHGRSRLAVAEPGPSSAQRGQADRLG